MFNKIWDLMNSKDKIHDMSNIIEKISHTIEMVDDAVAKDKNAKSGIIDAICQILQSHKEG